MAGTQNVQRIPIEKTFTVLTENLSFYENALSFDKKYPFSELLESIKKKLEESKSLLEAVTPEIAKALIDPKTKDKATPLINTLNQSETPTPQLIKKQLSEFIDISQLAFFISQEKLKSGWHKSTLEKFATLSKLKFHLFFDNLINLLKTLETNNIEIDEIVSTLLNKYLPAAASATYDIFIESFYLKTNGTNCKEIEASILKTDLPLLEKAFADFKKRIHTANEEASFEKYSDQKATSNDNVNAKINQNLLEGLEDDTISYYSCGSEEDFFDTEEYLTSDSENLTSMDSNTTTVPTNKPSNLENPESNKLKKWYTAFLKLCKACIAYFKSDTLSTSEAPTTTYPESKLPLDANTPLNPRVKIDDKPDRDWRQGKTPKNIEGTTVNRYRFSAAPTPNVNPAFDKRYYRYLARSAM